MLDDFQQRYDALKRSLAGVGYFRRGSLVRRFTLCGKPGCSCQATPPQPHGPYYQWTRKVRGKTVTVRLSSAQAALLADWIAAGRQIDRVLAQMERLSMRATQRLLRQAETTANEAPLRPPRPRRGKSPPRG